MYKQVNKVNANKNNENVFLILPARLPKSKAK